MVVLQRNLALGAALTGLGLVLSACSSSSSTDKPPTGGKAGSGGGITNPNTMPDTAPYGTDLQIVFPTMYSGYDGSRIFKIPAAVPGITGVKWTTTDPSYVILDDKDTTAGEGSVMITTKKAGKVKIIARAGSLSGAAELNITQYNSMDCDAGDMRYNNGVGIDGGTGAQALLQNQDKRVSCHSCHGEGAQFLSVQHTPLQTGGWTDDDITAIFTKGYKPDGSVFVTPFPPQIYQMFHKWDVTDEEKIGVVCYLRSIEPKSQDMLNFQGLRPPGMGGMMRPAGGAGAGAAGGGG